MKEKHQRWNSKSLFLGVLLIFFLSGISHAALENKVDVSNEKSVEISVCGVYDNRSGIRNDLVDLFFKEFDISPTQVCIKEPTRTGSSLQVFGTEYLTIETEGKVWLKLLDDNGIPVDTATCTIDMISPNNTAFDFNDQMMDRVNITAGVYVFDFSPSTLAQGVHPVVAQCRFPTNEADFFATDFEIINGTLISGDLENTITLDGQFHSYQIDPSFGIDARYNLSLNNQSVINATTTEVFLVWDGECDQGTNVQFELMNFSNSNFVVLPETVDTCIANILNRVSNKFPSPVNDFVSGAGIIITKLTTFGGGQGNKQIDTDRIFVRALNISTVQDLEGGSEVHIRINPIVNVNQTIFDIEGTVQNISDQVTELNTTILHHNSTVILELDAHNLSVHQNLTVITENQDSIIVLLNNVLGNLTQIILDIAGISNQVTELNTTLLHHNTTITDQLQSHNTSILNQLTGTETNINTTILNVNRSLSNEISAVNQSIFAQLQSNFNSIIGNITEVLNNVLTVQTQVTELNTTVLHINDSISSEFDVLQDNISQILEDDDDLAEFLIAMNQSIKEEIIELNTSLLHINVTLSDLINNLPNSDNITQILNNISNLTFESEITSQNITDILNEFGILNTTLININTSLSVEINEIPIDVTAANITQVLNRIDEAETNLNTTILNVNRSLSAQIANIPNLTWQVADRTVTSFAFFLGLNESGLTAIDTTINASHGTGLYNLSAGEVTFTIIVNNSLNITINATFNVTSNLTPEIFWNFENRTLTDYNLTEIFQQNVDIINDIFAHNQSVHQNLSIVIGNLDIIKSDLSAINISIPLNITAEITLEHGTGLYNETTIGLLEVIANSTFDEVKFTGASIYNPDDEGLLLVQFIKTSGGTPEPINDGTCQATVWFPDLTILLFNQTNMTFLNESDGIYFQNFTAPDTLGIYTSNFNCTRGTDRGFGQADFQVSILTINFSNVSESVWNFPVRTLTDYNNSAIFNAIQDLNLSINITTGNVTALIPIIENSAWPFAVIMLFVLVTASFYYMAFKMGEQHWAIRWIFLFLGLLVTFFTMGVGAEIALEFGQTQVSGLITTAMIPVGSIIFVSILWFMIHITRGYIKAFRANKDEKLVRDNLGF